MHLTRRRLLKIATAALPALPAVSGGLAWLGCGSEAGAGVAPAAVATERWPDSLVLAGHDERDLALSVLAGRLPRDLAGHHFVVCSLPYPEELSSPFNGLGMLYRLDLSASGVALRNRILRTDDYWVDLAAEGTPWAFRNQGIARFGAFGVRNFVNTALLPMGDRLLATFDAGRPHLVDPTSLEVVSPVGFNRDWRSGLEVLGSNLLFPGHFTTAHPAWDPHERRFYGVAYGGAAFGGAPFIEVMRWDGTGEVRRREVAGPDGAPIAIRHSMHQIGLTREHVVLCDTSFAISIDPRSAAAPKPDVDFWLVRKADLDGTGTPRAVHVSLPRETAHFLVDYDDAGGRIVLHAAHGCGAASSAWILGDDVVHRSQARVDPRDVGKVTAATDVGRLGRYEIDATTGAIRDAVAIGDESLTFAPSLFATTTGELLRDRHESLYWVSIGFSPENLVNRVVASFRDYPYRTREIDDLPTGLVPGALVRFDTGRAEIADAYVFPAGWFALSPQFAPAAGRSGPTEGYVVVSVVSDQPSAGSSGDEFWIFDGSDLARGPLCRLGHPDLDLPFTLHTAWLPALAPTDRSYWIDPRDDYGEALAALAPDAQAIARRALLRAEGG